MCRTEVTSSFIYFDMRNGIFTIGMSVLSLSFFAPSAFAATLPTMNQPDNGFFEGSNPEWAALHSTSSLGTEEHRQYHRDAVQSLLQWLDAHRSEKAAATYNQAHRTFLQDRNLMHRLFHTPVVVTPVINP